MKVANEVLVHVALDCVQQGSKREGVDNNVWLITSRSSLRVMDYIGFGFAVTSGVVGIEKKSRSFIKKQDDLLRPSCLSLGKDRFG